MNLFENAIRQGELLDFALGKNNYFIQDRDYGGHSVIQSYTNYVLPLMRERTETYVNTYLKQMVLGILSAKDIDTPEISHLIWWHLHVYYYLRSEGRLQGNIFSHCIEIENSLYPYLKWLKENDLEKYDIFTESIKTIQSRGGLLNFKIDHD